MTLKDLIRKKDKISDDPPEPIAPPQEPKAEFTILRSDTNTQEVLSAPTIPTEPENQKPEPHNLSKAFSRLRTASNASSTDPAQKSRPTSRDKESSRPSSRDEKASHRLSQRFHLSHSRNTSRSSANVPLDLPEMKPVSDLKGEEAQAAWEERATILAKENPNAHRRVSQDASRSPQGSRPSTPRKTNLQEQPDFHPEHLGDKAPRGRRLSDARSDDGIQEAIRLHEAGELETSTAMFGRLAEQHNTMAEIMYGLALRHGWGIPSNPELAISYLSRAASSSANVESEALRKGAKKGGAAKGELVLAIYELANSFRHGWGVAQDPVAARKYYEVAANLGDIDAMNEVAWCWEEGYGGKKDRVSLSISSLSISSKSGHVSVVPSILSSTVSERPNQLRLLDFLKLPITTRLREAETSSLSLNHS